MQDKYIVPRKSVFVSGALLIAGFVALTIAAQFHPHEISQNNHVLSFTQYAHWPGWTADHLLFFVAALITIAGLTVLIDALDVHDELPRLVARFATMAAVVAVALSAVRMMVDGVVLERAVNAWAAAPQAEAAGRYAAAEAVRWMEEGTGSYQSFMLGATMVALGALILWMGRVPRPVGLLLALGGAGYVVVGWIMGELGFAPEGAVPTYISQLLPVIAGAYLIVFALRTPRAEAAPMASSAVAVAE